MSRSSAAVAMATWAWPGVATTRPSGLTASSIATGIGEGLVGTERGNGETALAAPPGSATPATTTSSAAGQRGKVLAAEGPGPRDGDLQLCSCRYSIPSETRRRR